MKIVLVSKCFLDIEQYVEFKMSVLISPSKSLFSSRWVTFGEKIVLFMVQNSWGVFIRNSISLNRFIRFVKKKKKKKNNIRRFIWQNQTVDLWLTVSCSQAEHFIKISMIHFWHHQHPRGRHLVAIVGNRSWINQVNSDEVLCLRAQNFQS